MSIDVFESEAFETLWSRFIEVTEPAPSRPLQLETVIVPSAGWSTVLTRRILDQRMVIAGLRFAPFGQWMADLLGRLLGPELAPVRERDTLTWEVAAALPALLSDRHFGGLRSWLFAHSSELESQRLIDISRCVARLFDRYLLQRPELIAAWENETDWFEGESSADAPPDARWQRILWERISRHRPFRSVQAMTDDLARNLAATSDCLPERVCIWHCGAFSPVQLRFLECIGQRTAINLFLLVPARTFWGDMRGRRETLRRLRDSSLTLREFCDRNHLDLLHPLLASMGRLSRLTQMLMVDCDEAPWRHHEIEGDVVTDTSRAGCAATFADAVGAQLPKNCSSCPGDSSDIPDSSDTAADFAKANNVPASLLSLLQADVRAAAEPVARSIAMDDSIRIHNCHSPMREVEVLQNELRAAFERSPDLMPEDVAVYCPDLEAYAPLITAVFGRTKLGEPLHLPFHLAGRSPRRVYPLIESWTRLTKVLQGRFSVTEVLDLLAMEGIGSAAGFEQDHLSLLSEWVGDAGIRWGLDVEQRSEEGLPPNDAGTWRFGLDRLLLGCVMPPGGRQLAGETLALDRAAGLKSSLLGSLWDFIERLRHWKRETSRPRSIGEWIAPVSRMTQQILDTSTDEAATMRILDAIDELGSLAGAGRFTLPISFEVFVREVNRLLEESAQGRPFRTGGITFCSMDALRSLPMRVIGLLGMNDGAFPRPESTVRFDLIQRRPMPGDFSQRDQDRHLFLEAILAVRDRLIITYCGQDIRSQRQKPPSVVVDELLDVLCSMSRLSDGAAANGESAATMREQLVVVHPLQAFSPRCFDGRDQRLEAYSPAALAIAEQLIQPRGDAPPFVVRPLPEESDVDEVAIGDLIRLAERPWQLFLNRLGIRLPEDGKAVDDRETLTLNRLDQWKIADEWLSHELGSAGASQTAVRGPAPATMLKRDGSIPAGSLGEAALVHVQFEVSEIMKGLSQERPSDLSCSLHVDHEFDGLRLTGTLKNWSSAGLFVVTPSMVDYRHAPRLWVQQLVATVARGAACPAARWFGREGKGFTVASIEPVEAVTELRKLLRLWKLARRFPLPFLPTSTLFKELEKEAAKGFDWAEPDFQRRLAKAMQPGNGFGGAGQDPDASFAAAFDGCDPWTLTVENLELAGEPGGEPLSGWLVRQIALPVLRTTRMN